MLICKPCIAEGHLLALQTLSPGSWACSSVEGRLWCQVLGEGGVQALSPSAPLQDLKQPEG